MSIKPSTITAVLLADGWHQIRFGSFALTDWEITLAEPLEFLSGRSATRGFNFAEQDGREVSGPITSVLAVRH